MVANIWTQQFSSNQIIHIISLIHKADHLTRAGQFCCCVFKSEKLAVF